MGLFSSKNKLTEAQRKWNLMWDLWAAGNAAAPYAQLMEYDSEVNNGGHEQYFYNVAHCADLKESVAQCLNVLPEPLRTNLQRSYDAFTSREDICDETYEKLFSECDNVFYDNEQLLLDILEDYANSLPLT